MEPNQKPVSRGILPAVELFLLAATTAQFACAALALSPLFCSANQFPEAPAARRRTQP